MDKTNAELVLKMVRDLETTRFKYAGYAYVRTIRNILTGNYSAAIAPHFSNKPYFGLFSFLSLRETENILDQLVRNNQLDTVYTNHGKLYCTHERAYF